MIRDLRSDTVTRPSEAMLNYMMKAHVGDDVFHEDPMVNELEQIAAEMFKMEDAVFCASGTMANQIAIKCHTQPGDEVICEKSSHVYIYEGGGIAFNSGCQVHPIEGVRGLINVEDIIPAINPDDVHRARTRLVSLENTANRGGGACYEMDEILAIKELCKQNNLKLHLDGARLFNALIAKNQSPEEFGETFDSISICLSKGLGAPVGSILMGSKDFIKQSRRIRKVMGGGMRQAGYLAAAGLFAFRHNIDRLKDDHHNAKTIANALLEKDFVGKMMPVETNIIIFEVIGRYTPKSFCQYLREREILCLPISPTQVRMVTHLDIYNSEISGIVNTIINM